jgi:DNA-binding response OmpR family regulator
MSQSAARRDLDGKTILIIEDNYLISQTARRGLENFGADILGPAGTIAQAKSLLGGKRCDAAVLDISLDGEDSFAIADELAAQKTPFVFATGFGDDIVPPRFSHVALIEKPYTSEGLAAAVARLFTPGD